MKLDVLVGEHKQHQTIPMQNVNFLNMFTNDIKYSQNVIFMLFFYSFNFKLHLFNDFLNFLFNRRNFTSNF